MSTGQEKMMKTERGDKPMQLPPQVHLLKQQMQQLLQPAKGERQASPKMEEKERRGLCVKITSLTKDAQKKINVLMLAQEKREYVSDVGLLVMT